MYQQYLGKFSLTTSLDNFSVTDTGGGGAQAVTLTTGDYYIAGYSGEGTSQLCEHMQAQIRALGGNFADAEITYSGTTGLITLNCPSTTTTTWTWTDSALQTMLGFTGTQSGAKSYTATNHPRFVWRPSLSAAEYPADLATWWSPDSTSHISIAPDGTSTPTEGSTIYGSAIMYEPLDAAEVRSTSSTVWRPFEDFWEDVIHKGSLVRVYPDRTLSASTSFKTGRILPPDADVMSGESVRIGSLDLYRERVNPGWNGLWRVMFRMHKTS